MLGRRLLAEYSYSIKDSSFIFENVHFLILLVFQKWEGGGVGGLALPAPSPARALVVSKLLELRCHWKVQNRTRRGLTKKLYTIYPRKKNYLCIVTLPTPRGLVTGTAVLPDEKCCGYAYMQPLAGSQPVQWRHWCSRRSTLPF